MIACCLCKSRQLITFSYSTVLRLDQQLIFYDLGSARCDVNLGLFFLQLSETLTYGDIYVTRHSNLSQVHVIFHLVSCDSLKTQEINSRYITLQNSETAFWMLLYIFGRHSCINGLRNIIRLCYKFGVTNISIPLLLVDSLTEVRLPKN